MDWTNFVQDRGKWLTAVNADVELRVPLPADMVAFAEGCYFIQLADGYSCNFR
jgi:hypothetical protein